jgi:hypothetical protein
MSLDGRLPISISAQTRMVMMNSPSSLLMSKYWENLETEEHRRERSALDQLEENVQSDLASHLEISQLENEIRSMEDLLKLHDRCDSGSAASPEMGEPTTEAILAERALSLGPVRMRPKWPRPFFFVLVASV